MNRRRPTLWLWILVLPWPGVALAQDLDQDRESIRRNRLAQNAAIANGDFAEVAAHWVEDVVVTASLGFVLTGAESYRRALEDSDLTYERLPEEIDVSSHWPLAFEKGRWEGRDESGAVQVSGLYSAQWVKDGETWLIRSELYVALACSGEACAWPVGTRPGRPGAQEGERPTQLIPGTGEMCTEVSALDSQGPFFDTLHIVLQDLPEFDERHSRPFDAHGLRSSTGVRPTADSLIVFLTVGNGDLVAIRSSLADEGYVGGVDDPATEGPTGSVVLRPIPCPWQ